MNRAKLLLAVIGFGVFVLSSFESTSAQDARVQIEAARAQAMQRAAARAGKGGQPPMPNKPNANKPDAEKKKEGEEGDKKKKDGEDSSDSIKRPEKPPRVPDPREFDVKPDEDGRILFNFYGQGWPDVLQWLANISDYSLDWQELPKDYVNVTTTQKYTIAQAHDLFNRLLLERGYTMIPQGRILSVVRISKVDPSLLTRVADESELLDLPAHQLVKITFKLPDKLKADQAANDIKSLLSSHAKVHPLMATNRLLVIDAVINLREASQLINAEHAAAAGHTVPQEFPVHFARADRVADQVMILLGLDPSSRRTPQELQVEQQKLQLFQQMQQRGKDVTKFLRPGSAPTVYLAVNDRNNSILANAPPAELQTIERAIKHLDVPNGSTAGAFGNFGPASNALTMEKYTLATISPQSILDALESIGDLDPRTRVRTDSDASVVWANATARDHEKIKKMVDSLDGSGRNLEVIWLRRLPAIAVAETLTKLMVGEKEEKDNNRRSYYDYYSYRSSRGNEKKDKGEFRVDADIERNRLLLWCTEAELAEVKSFLEKLGEIPGRSGNPNTVRFLDPRSAEDTIKLLEQIQRTWQGPNKLDVTVPEPEEDATEEGPEPESKVKAPQAKTTSVDQASFFVAAQAAEEQAPQVPAKAEESKADPDAATVQPPLPELEAAEQEPEPPAVAGITIAVTPDGRIMLHSSDAAALDQLEDLMSSLAAPAPNHKVYYLKNGFASLVRLNLEEYFEEDEEFNSEDNWWRAWNGMGFETADQGSGLSASRKLRFIYDIDTNSILVRNASPSQLATIDALIEIYDKAPSEDSYSARAFQIFKLEYSQADAVAKTIKEVFRDLLSSKDKDFAKEQQGEKQGSGQPNYVRIYGSGMGNDDDKKPSMVKASFEGALSVGVDDISNTVIVSAQEEWMPSIAAMIEYLDQNAKPQTAIATHQVSGQVNADSLKTALAGILGEAWIGQRPPKFENQQQQQPNQQQPMDPRQLQIQAAQQQAAAAAAQNAE
jgi:type II secretory pathway component GspD/PulD (secretin)